MLDIHSVIKTYYAEERNYISRASNNNNVAAKNFFLEKANDCRTQAEWLEELLEYRQKYRDDGK